MRQLATIKKHLEFVRAVRAFAWQDDPEQPVIARIDADCRDEMTEPEFYGLRALEAAEEWFDALPLDYLKFLEDAQLPEGTRLVMRQSPEKSSPSICAMCWIDGKAYDVTAGGVKIAYGEGWGFEMIATQGSPDNQRPAVEFQFEGKLEQTDVTDEEILSGKAILANPLPFTFSLREGGIFIEPEGYGHLMIDFDLGYPQVVIWDAGDQPHPNDPSHVIRLKKSKERDDHGQN